MCLTLLTCLTINHKPQELLEAIFQTVTAASAILELFFGFVLQFLGLET